MTRIVGLIVFLFCSVNVASAEIKVEKVVSTSADHFLGGHLTLKVANLDALISEGIENLRLQLNGRVLIDSRATASAAADGTIEFPLIRGTNDHSAWNGVLGSPPLSGEKTIRVSLVKSTGAAYPGPQDITFRIFNQFLLCVSAIICLLALGLLLYLGRKTNLLRDAVIITSTSTKGVPLTDLRPFSLGRCQMAFWLFLITSAFLLIWIATGQFNGILTSDSLVLLGICGTTGLAAIGVDEIKGSQGRYGASTSQGFFRDILCADGGPALHRVQSFIWTIVLGSVFVRSAYASLQLPQFDATLLTMIGISGGLYIGFKFPEQKKGG